MCIVFPCRSVRFSGPYKSRGKMLDYILFCLKDTKKYSNSVKKSSLFYSDVV